MTDPTAIDASPGTPPPPGDASLEMMRFADALNEIDQIEREAFGDAVNAAIVRHVKAATLQGGRAGVRGLARVLGLQPATVRRRLARLIDEGWIERDEEGLRYSAEALRRGRTLTRRMLLRLARVYRDLGWGDIRPPKA